MQIRGLVVILMLGKFGVYPCSWFYFYRNGIMGNMQSEAGKGEMARLRQLYDGIAVSSVNIGRCM